MIEFTRTSDISIDLKFDAEGLQNLTEAMRSVLAGASTTIEAAFDMPIVTMKRRSPKKQISLIVTPGEATTLNRVDDQIVWALHWEDADCALLRFLNCQEMGLFNPAEFLSIQTRKNKNSDHVYCTLV
jgi:hypothetical protein